MLFASYRFSWARAFQDMLKEVHDMAGQHEVIAENTQQQLINSVHRCVAELKTDRKKVSLVLQFRKLVWFRKHVCTSLSQVRTECAGLMDKQVGRETDRSVAGWFDGQMAGWIHEWMNRGLDGWMDKWMVGGRREGGWMDGRMDLCMKRQIDMFHLSVMLSRPWNLTENIDSLLFCCTANKMILWKQELQKLCKVWKRQCQFYCECFLAVQDSWCFQCTIL